MMSGTGNRSFTLVEVMVTAAILSLGAVLIYESFFISLDLFDYCSDYLDIAPWMDEKTWQVQDQLERFGDPASEYITASGSVTRRNRIFDWNLSHEVIGSTEEERLYKIDLVLFARQGRKKIRLSRSAYAIGPYER